MTIQDQATACSCCVGVERLVPSTHVNRPGLRELSWRVGTHARFAATMLAAISRHERLHELGRRTPDDFTIALLDAWAIPLDVLTFYQERILNESYLGTAVRRSSKHYRCRKARTILPLRHRQSQVIALVAPYRY